VTTPQQIEIPPPSLDDVLYRKDQGFAWVTLNRPVVLNAVNWSIRRRLFWALEQAEADDEVRAVILTGAAAPSALVATSSPPRRRMTCPPPARWRSASRSGTCPSP
jgi:1,4-dihydroxy-2-naphthoyl-CoA synthase